MLSADTVQVVRAATWLTGAWPAQQVAVEPHIPVQQHQLLPYLPQAADQLVLLGRQALGVAVAHGKVNLAAVAPQPGRVGWKPRGKQPDCNRERAAVSNKEGQGLLERCCVECPEQGMPFPLPCARGYTDSLALLRFPLRQGYSLLTLLQAQVTQGREDLQLKKEGEKPVQSHWMLKAEAWSDS